jgi:serine acetyltransferase
MSSFDKHILKCYYYCNNLYYNKKLNILNKIILKLVNRYYGFLLKFLYGAFIPYKARIGTNINFIHSFHGVFISQYAVIGNNCSILHHVTIGSSIQKMNVFEAPIVGDEVFIGCNVCIIGKTIIGNKCKIGAGVVITNKRINDKAIVINKNITVIEVNT